MSRRRWAPKVSLNGTAAMFLPDTWLRIDLLWLALGWVGYAVVHSLLAAQRCKAFLGRLWPASGRYYRLIYNLLAVLLLLPLLWATLTLPGPWLWRWQGVAGWLMDALALAALLLLLATGYDLGEFLGLKALRRPSSLAADEAGDGFRLSPLHRHVRHPWYALALVLIWTRDMNAPLLVSSLAITAYFIVGSRFEEGKLRDRFGPVYAEYQRRVPALLPSPWRHLSAAEAAALQVRARLDDERRRHHSHRG